MKRTLTILLTLAIVISSLGITNIQVNATENNMADEINTADIEQKDDETEAEDSTQTATDIKDFETGIDQTAPEIDSTNNEIGVEEQETQEIQVEEDPELTDRANSWRYEDGVLLHQSGTDGFGRSRARAAYNPNATGTGIDVSHHDGTIDWEKVKAAGIDFVIIRCGYGQNKTSQDDRQWARNVSECERLGIPYGVYLYSYATDTNEALSEAQHVLRLINGHNLSYPVYFDMEDNSTIGSDLSSIAKTFCNTIKNAGYAVGVYASLNWWNTYLTDTCFSQWYRWVAQYNSTCKYTGEYAIWQYSSTGRVSGISTDVDMNYLIGSPKDHGVSSGIEIPVETKNMITYSAHVSDVGWMSSVSNGLIAGTVGQNKQLEALKININNNEQLQVESQVNVSGLGWQDTVKEGETVGTVGKGKAIEAIRFQLTGEDAAKYNIYYRAYVRTVGWLDWAKDGESAGSEGYGYPMEAYQVVVLPESSNAPGKMSRPYYDVNIVQQAHISDIGWQNEKMNGEIIGTTGENKGIEAYKLTSDRNNLSVEYASCIEGNWQNDVADGQVSGTTGKAKHIEAIKIKLSGEDKDKYSIYYRVHVSNLGWLDWTCDGQPAGTKNYNYAIEAIQIYVLAKNSSDTPTLGTAYKEKIKNVSYEAHVSDEGWQKSVSDGSIAGTTGKNRGIEALKVTTDLQDVNVEYSSSDPKGNWQDIVKNGDISGSVGKAKTLGAIKISLSGESSDKYRVYYRVHVTNLGWLGWTANGEMAGTKGYGYKIEAIQIKILSIEDKNIPVIGNAYKEKDTTLSYCAHIRDLGWQNWVENGEQAGTTGKAKAVEALKIQLEDSLYAGNVEYQAHVRDLGWQNWSKNGEQIGTTGRALSVEAVKIKLTGKIEKHYDIEYRVHVQDLGWQDWVKNGEQAGTTGKAKAIEAIQIKLVKKDEK